jgi:hypothetical protein
MDVEKIIASIESTTKVLDGKVIVDASAIEELKKADTTNKELIAAEQSKTADLTKQLETVTAQVNVLETEKVVAESKAYVTATEAAMYQAECDKEKRFAERKKKMEDKGFADEATIATAMEMTDEDFAKFLASLEKACELGKARAEKTIAQKEQTLSATDLTKAKAEVPTTNEMDLGLGGTIKEKMAKMVSSITNEIKK